jgi:hypothetical protein
VLLCCLLHLQEEMDAARIPWAWRDYCAHLLIPLNKCRRQNAYMPWACGHEKHVYEKCEYKVRAAVTAGYVFLGPACSCGGGRLQ